MVQRFDNQRGTAPIVDSIKNEKPKLRYSKSDLSAQIAFDAHIGMVIPFDLIETLPDSDYTINYDIVAITRNPLVRRLLSGMSVFIHTYGEDLKDMWEGFPRFITRGRSGTASLQIPTTKTYVKDTTQEDNPRFFSTVFSPSAYLGVRPKFLKSSEESSVGYNFYNFGNHELYYHWNDDEQDDDETKYTVNPTVTFSALSLVMYQQICIYNYMPSNLVQHNKNFFPDNELHLILADDASGQTVWSLSYNTVEAKKAPTIRITDVALAFDDTPVYLDSMRVRQFRGDEFTTGLPFPDLVRGDIPSLSFGNVEIPASSGDVFVQLMSAPATPVGEVSVHAGLAKGRTSESSAGISSGSIVSLDWGSYNIADDGDPTVVVTLRNQGTTDINNVLNANADKLQLGPLYAKVPAQTVSLPSTVTMSQLRSLAVLTKFREIMARTDGSYNEMIKSQFGSSPQLHNHKPFYIGGIKQELIFSEVVQTSESSSGNPLGKTASRGVTAGSGYVGRYHSKDYGYIMSVLSIVPDVFYHQGLDKKWSRIEQSDFYFPINNNLSPEALLNKRLYFRGVDAVDNDLFAYQERDSDYKSRRNRVAGRLVMTASQSEEDNAYVMKRTFRTTPTLSYGFVGMFPSNIDMSIFASMNDTPFIFNIASRIEAVQPIPYTTVPSDLGIVS